MEQRSWSKRAIPGNSIFQGNPILPEMSLAYDDLSSTGTPLSIFPLANDYLMTGQRTRDKQDVRDRRDS